MFKYDFVNNTFCRLLKIKRINWRFMVTNLFLNNVLKEMVNCF